MAPTQNFYTITLNGLLQAYDRTWFTLSHSVSKANPRHWTQKWISGAEVQVAPQETETPPHVIGGVKQDVDDKTFSGLPL